MLDSKTKIEKFRLMNGLTKKQIAEFLGVSDVFVGKLCSGVYKLPGKHVMTLINNDKGWDTSALREMGEEDTDLPVQDFPQLFGNQSGIELLQRISKVLESVADTQSSFIEAMKMKDEQIRSLTKIIDNLTKK